MNTKSLIHTANALDALANTLLAIGIVLLPNLALLGMINILRGIPFKTDIVTSVEHQSCINIGVTVPWEEDLITTEQGYSFFWYGGPVPTPGEEVYMSIWMGYLGFFHLGTCVPTEKVMR